MARRRVGQGVGSLLGMGGYLLGVDIGGYGLQVALANVQGELLQTRQRVLESGLDAAQVVRVTMEMIRELLRENKVRADQLVRIGIGFAGPVDVAQGETILSHRMPGWERYPLRQTFADELDVTTLVDNDARVIAVGEALLGAGRGVHTVFYIHLSSGVGGGLVVDGQPYRGATTTARIRDDPLGLRIHHIVEAAREGHAPSRQVLSEAAHYLALAVANLVNLLNPEMIVLGGVVARLAGEDLLQPLREEVAGLAMTVPGQAARIVLGSLGETSVVVGAIALALQSLEE
jgi:glucokinase